MHLLNFNEELKDSLEEKQQNGPNHEMKLTERKGLLAKGMNYARLHKNAQHFPSQKGIKGK